MAARNRDLESASFFFFVGEPEVNTVMPFTKVDLSQIPFHEIIRNFLILEAGNIPENPLLYLYPNTPRDEAFGKYYSKKAGGKAEDCVVSTATEQVYICLKIKKAWHDKHLALQIRALSKSTSQPSWLSSQRSKCIRCFVTAEFLQLFGRSKK